MKILLGIVLTCFIGLYGWVPLNGKAINRGESIEKKDLATPGDGRLALKMTSAKEAIATPGPFKGKPRKDHQDQTGFYFLFLILFLMLAFVRILDPKYIKELIRTLIDSNYSSLMAREGKFGFRLVNVLLDLLFVTGVGLLLFFAQEEHGVVDYLIFTGYILGVYLMYLVALGLISRIFFEFGGSKVCLRNNITHHRVIGVILWPMLFLAYFLEPFFGKWLIYSGEIITGTFFLLRIGRNFWEMKSVFDYGFFYNFLYICTIEIAPLIVICKELSLNTFNY